MIEREVLKDIKDYKAKLFGPFTLRNVVCILLAAIVSLPIYFILNIWFITMFSIIIAGIFAVPFLICGFKEIYGLPAEKFIKQYIVLSIMSPKERKYKTKNIFDPIAEPMLQVETKKQRKQRLKSRKEDAAKLGDKFKAIL